MKRRFSVFEEKVVVLLAASVLTFGWRGASGSGGSIL